MYVKKIFLVRHAKPVSPDNKKRFLGQTDIPLSPEGSRQAESLARELVKHPITGIYSSDLLRASQTASPIAEKFNLHVQTEKRFREINMGDWENLTFTEVRSNFTDEFEKRGKNIAHYRRPGGECFADVQARALAAFSEIVLGSITGDVVIVAHSGVNRMILCSVMNVPIADLFTIKMGYASAYEILVKGNKIIVTGNIINL
jgi:alpha-ribazole phosphatase